MNIRKFFAQLLPSFERNRLTEDVDLLRKELHDTLNPALETASKMVRANPMRAKSNTVLNEQFAYHLREYQRYDIIHGLSFIFSSVPGKLDVIDSLIPDTFAKDVTKETLTYRKVSIIRYLETVRFAAKYATKLLLRMVAVETDALNNAGANPSSEMTPAEIKWLNENADGFFQALKVLNVSQTELSTKLSEIPDIIVVPERYDVIKQTVGVDKLDPLRFNLFPANDYNLIYRFRLTYAEWQVKQYEAKLEEKRVLELRLLALKQAYEGKQDARLQQQISYNDGRLQKLNYQIERIEQQHKHA